MYAPVTITLCLITALANAGPIIQRRTNEDFSLSAGQTRSLNEDAGVHYAPSRRQSNLGSYSPGIVVGEGELPMRSLQSNENGASHYAPSRRQSNLGSYSPGIVVGEGELPMRSLQSNENGASHYAPSRRQSNLGAYAPGIVVGEGELPMRSLQSSENSDVSSGSETYGGKYGPSRRQSNLGAYAPGLVVGEGAISMRSPLSNGNSAGPFSATERQDGYAISTPIDSSKRHTSVPGGQPDSQSPPLVEKRQHQQPGGSYGAADPVELALAGAYGGVARQVASEDILPIDVVARQEYSAGPYVERQVQGGSFEGRQTARQEEDEDIMNLEIDPMEVVARQEYSAGPYIERRATHTMIEPMVQFQPREALDTLEARQRSGKALSQVADSGIAPLATQVEYVEKTIVARQTNGGGVGGSAVFQAIAMQTEPASLENSIFARQTQVGGGNNGGSNGGSVIVEGSGGNGGSRVANVVVIETEPASLVARQSVDGSSPGGGSGVSIGGGSGGSIGGSIVANVIAQATEPARLANSVVARSTVRSGGGSVVVAAVAAETPAVEVIVARQDEAGSSEIGEGDSIGFDLGNGVISRRQASAGGASEAVVLQVATETAAAQVLDNDYFEGAAVAQQSSSTSDGLSKASELESGRNNLKIRADSDQTSTLSLSQLDEQSPQVTPAVMKYDSAIGAIHSAYESASSSFQSRSRLASDEVEARKRASRPLGDITPSNGENWTIKVREPATKNVARQGSFEDEEPIEGTW